MGILTEQLADVPRVRRIVSLQIDSVALTASATVREGVVIDSQLVATRGDLRVDIPQQLAAAQLTQPIGAVAQAAGLTEEQLLGMSFADLMVAFFDVPA
jgi:hypothetical protein